MIGATAHRRQVGEAGAVRGHPGHAHHDHADHATCDCPAHAPRASPPGAGAWWASVAPVLACAICPACISTYAKTLSALGVGLYLTEAQHAVLLGVAVTISLVVGFWRARRTGRFTPLSLTLIGCALVLAAHALDDNPWLAWSGVVALLGGGVWEHRIWRRATAVLE
jgi:hypothetical protein